MDRARRAALVILLVIACAMTFDSARPGAVRGPEIVPAADVGWPPSGGLLVAEIVTGGASASDEYVEIVNAGSAATDLAGLEVVYVTASGSTVTRKATWSASALVEPGRRVLLGNASGAFAAAADVTYSGGFAATGGTIVLRAVGGSPIDAVGWGDATNEFVEGSAAIAPPAGSSIERRPGGSAGNSVDSNVNAADLVINAAPEPRNASAGPLPGPMPSPSPTSAPLPSPVPSPTPTPTVQPSASAAPSSTPSASPEPPPTPTPTPTPTVSPPPVIVSIDAARALPDGSTVAVEGVVTTTIGALESGRGGFAQDATAGISIYLSALPAAPIPTGAVIRVVGTMDERYSQRTLRASPDDLSIVGSAELPAAEPVTTGGAGELVEGRRVSASGVVVSSPSDLADGIGLDIDDGTGPLRVVVGPDAQSGSALTVGSLIEVVGVLGQRDSSGTGTSGYRIHAANAGDVTVAAPPSPDPSSAPSAGPSVVPSPEPSMEPTIEPSPGPSAEPSPSTTPEPTPSAEPSPSSAPSASPDPSLAPSPPPSATISIATARLAAVGSSVRVVGVVTAERGRIGHPDTIAIDDGTAGILVRLPESITSPPRGTIVDVVGVLAEPHGQREIRPGPAGLIDLGPGTIVAPIAIVASAVGEATEGRLVAIEGRVTKRATTAASGDLSFEVRDESGTVRVMADASAGIERSSITLGAGLRLVGVVGQRASRKGRLDGYRLWLRDPGDVALLVAPPEPSPSSDPLASSSPDDLDVTIARAIVAGGRASIEATVIAGSSLLDATGRRIVVSDASAGIEVLVPKDSVAPPVGSRVRISGEVGRAYGAPRIRAVVVMRLGRRTIEPIDLTRPPSAAHEWRLARLSGTVTDLHKFGQRWRAEVRMTGGATTIVNGLSGAGIEPERVAEGRRIIVTGIVRRPYPTSKDRRYALLPRGRGDIVVLDHGSPADRSASADGGSSRRGVGTAHTPDIAGTAVPDADLAALAAHVGERVRIGGLIVEVVADGIVLDDGTAHGRVALEGAAAEYLALLEPADAINVTGVVRRSPTGGFEVVATDGADLARAGDPEPADAEASELAAPWPSGAELSGLVASPRRGLLALDDDLAAPLTGVGSLVAVALASVAVTLLRRRRANRRLAARVLQRLASLSRPADMA